MMLPTVEYDSKEEISHSQYQVQWSETMDQGHFQASALYKKIEVLMLHWGVENDDLGVAAEVNSLKAVFEEKFKYNVQVEQMATTEDLEVDMNALISQWTREHNKPETLLIVYYAGHGRPGLVPGELRFHG